MKICLFSKLIWYSHNTLPVVYGGEVTQNFCWISSDLISFFDTIFQEFCQNTLALNGHLLNFICQNVPSTLLHLVLRTPL